MPAQEERDPHPITQQAPSRAQTTVTLAYAGSLNAVISEDSGPGFTTAPGFPLINISGPSVGLAHPPGLRLKRSDPGGYRVVFLFQLAERYYKLPGLRDRILQGDDNEGQIVHEDYARPVKTGAADAVVTYITHALFHGLPYISLPDELDQSNPMLKELYATAHYTNPQGQIFHGTPAVYSVTIPKGSRNQEGAEAFVRYLLSESGRSALLRRGFPPIDVLVGGDETAVPPSLRHLIQGHYSQ